MMKENFIELRLMVAEGKWLSNPNNLICIFKQELLTLEQNIEEFKENKDYKILPVL